MKKTIQLLLILSIILVSCKKDLENSITIDLVGEWRLETFDNGSFDPYDNTIEGQYHTTTQQSLDDFCTNGATYSQEKNLTDIILNFKESNLVSIKHVYEYTVFDFDNSTCADHVLKIVEETEETIHDWQLDGQKLSIKNFNEDYEVENIEKTTMTLTKPGIKGDVRISDLFKKM